MPSDPQSRRECRPPHLRCLARNALQRDRPLDDGRKALRDAQEPERCAATLSAPTSVVPPRPCWRGLRQRPLGSLRARAPRRGAAGQQAWRCFVSGSRRSGGPAAWRRRAAAGFHRRRSARELVHSRRRLAAVRGGALGLSPRARTRAFSPRCGAPRLSRADAPGGSARAADISFRRVRRAPNTGLGGGGAAGRRACRRRRAAAAGAAAALAVAAQRPAGGGSPSPPGAPVGRRRERRDEPQLFSSLRHAAHAAASAPPLAAAASPHERRARRTSPVGGSAAPWAGPPCSRCRRLPWPPLQPRRRRSAAALSVACRRAPPCRPRSWRGSGWWRAQTIWAAAGAASDTENCLDGPDEISRELGLQRRLVTAVYVDRCRR